MLLILGTLLACAKKPTESKADTFSPETGAFNETFTDSGGEPEARVEVAITVFISATTHGVTGGELRARQGVAGRNQRGKRDRQEDRWASNPSGDTDADEYAGSDHRAEAHHDRASYAEVTR